MATVGGNTRGVPQVYCHGEPPILILGGFAANAGGAIPTANVWGKGFTVAKGSAAGEYTVTLATPMRGTLHLEGSAHNTANAYVVTCNAANAQSGVYTLVVRHGNATNINMAAGEILTFKLWGTITDLSAGNIW